ncbi:MAG: hypothetical protein L6R41_001721 [Letrouitia leprolyta]|nr:MAG: hypothetical protein L6R41_001721 [Letrouitia leprolyta]
MASNDEAVYHPKDAISASVRSTLVSGGAGLFLSAVQNNLTRQNVTGWGVFTRTGSTIAMFAAIGGTFEFVRVAAANLREKEDAYNPAIGGFFAGGIVGLRIRSLPAVLGFGALLAIIQGTHEYTGGRLSGFERDTSVDQYERKEQLRRNRRRPIEETLQELGEGREIRERISELGGGELDAAARNIAMTQCLTDINELKNEVGSRTNQIAPHDQRTFNEVLKGLNQQLQEARSKFAPKRKFAFKPKASATLLNQSSGTSASLSIEKKSSRTAEETSEYLVPEPVEVSTNPSNLQEASALKDVHHELRTESDFRHIDRGIVMINSSQCVIRCALPSPRMTINNIHTSMLVAGPIHGAAFVTGLSASVLVVTCQQLRMHRCQDCVVYLRCSSKPIIEDCSSIQFGPFPDELVRKRFFAIVDQWDQVHDFNWLKAGHSPNWSIFPPEKRKSPDRWKLLKNVTNDKVDEVLQELGATI